MAKRHKPWRFNFLHSILLCTCILTRSSSRSCFPSPPAPGSFAKLSFWDQIFSSVQNSCRQWPAAARCGHLLFTKKIIISLSLIEESIRKQNKSSQEWDAEWEEFLSHWCWWFGCPIITQRVPQNISWLEKDRDKELEGDTMPQREALGELIRGKSRDSNSKVSQGFSLGSSLFLWDLTEESGVWRFWGIVAVLVPCPCSPGLSPAVPSSGCPSPEPMDSSHPWGVRVELLGKNQLLAGFFLEGFGVLSFVFHNKSIYPNRALTQEKLMWDRPWHCKALGPIPEHYSS